MSASAVFSERWKESFQDEIPPEMECLKHHGVGSLDPDKQQAYRKSLKVDLDQHTSIIEELEKKLSREQFIVEFIAQELEKLPVPRYVNSSTLQKSDSKTSPPTAIRSTKPRPNPRGAPPSVAKKPNPPPRMSMAIPPTQPQASGAIKRVKTTPPVMAGERRIQYGEEPKTGNRSLDSAELPTETPPLNTSVNTVESINITPTNESSGRPRESSDADRRFSSFQGSTFGGSSSTTSPPAPEYKNESPQRKRDSMKKMKTFSLDGDDSDTSPVSTPCSDTSEYQQIWVTPSAGPGAVLLDGTQNTTNTTIEETSRPKSELTDPADSSAASIQSTGVTRSRSKGSNRMVRVDYNNSGGGAPQPIKEAGSIDEENETSDLEDENPQYVRLMFRAYSTASIINRTRKPDTESVGSSGSDTTDSAPSQNNSSQANNKISIDVQGRVDSMDDDKKPHSDEVIATSSSENGRMRNWVVNSILQSETSYVEDLNVLLKYKDILEKRAGSSQPVISAADVKIIFGNLDAIHKLHSDMKSDLAPIVAEWSERSEVAHLFKIMAVNLPLYQTYLENYPRAIATLKKCCAETPKFDELVKEIKCPSTPEPQHLEEILHKPVNRMQRNSLVLHDFIKCTHKEHLDYPMLLQSLKLNQHFLESIKIVTDKTGKSLRVLVKNQLLVEYVGNQARKLRHVFLFNDVIVCTRFNNNKGKNIYEVKWHVPLDEMVLSDRMDDTPVEWKKRADKTEKEINAMKSKLKGLKADLRKEMKECKERHIDTSTNKKVQNLTSKIQDHEGKLILAEPRLRLTVGTKKDKYVFLLPSDYERREWQESIQALKDKLPSKVPKINQLDAQNIINSCKDTVHLNSVGQMVMKEAVDEDIVSGQLTVTIHKIQGLQEDCDTFTAVEVDSFGHFVLKAKTHTIQNSKTPVWNESFEIDLEAAGTMRLICYQRAQIGDVLLGKCALDLNKQWLKQGFNEKELSMNDVTLTISIKYRSADQTIRRIPSRIESGLFGVKISNIYKREGHQVPVFVTSCIHEVESRGLDEMGIYRVSGTTTDVQRLRKAFDKNTKVGKTLLAETDINAVTGAFKLYFRELPEALFTDDLYPDLVEGYKIQDKEEKERRMISLLASLPDPNYYTIMALLTHLVKVCSYEAQNKMPFHNLAVVFGPTLLKPADKGEPTNPMDLFSSGANDAMYQSGILFYYLTLQQKGVQFR